MMRLPVKSLAFSLTFFLITTLLTACSGQSGPGQPPSGDSAATAQNPAGSSAKNIADKLPNGKKPTLRQLNTYSDGGVDYNKYPVAKLIEEKTGYHVEYDMLPKDGAAEKLNLIMATQEYYDIMVAGSIDVVNNFAKEGALTDLTPWLPYAPRLNAAINDYEKKTFTIDGKLYAIGMQSPLFGGAGQVSNTIFLRQDYLDKAGLKVPDTLDNLKSTLQALKSFDNKKGVSTIPLTLASSAAIVNSVVGAFGMPNEWNEVGGKLVNRAADPRMKDYLAYMKQLYQEKLIDVDYPANQNANVYEKFSTGVAASAYLSCYDYTNFGDSMKKLQPDSKISYMAPVKGADGKKALGVTAGGMDRIAFVPAVCKNIEHVVNFMELKLEPALFEELTIGQKGVHYTVDDKGGRWPILPIFNDERGNSVNYYTGRPSEQYAEMWKLRVKKRADIWEAWNFINNDPISAGSFVISPVGYSPSFPSKKNVQSLTSMFNDQCIKTIAGSSTVDDYDRFTKDWLAAGGQALTSDYNTWYATYKTQK